ncbi:MAG: hypothetical protein WAV04_01880 [Candidatus Microsaccharimonas sp.]
MITDATPPLEFDDSLASELPAVPTIARNAPLQPTYQYPSSALLSVYGVNQGNQSILGASSSEAAFLEATPQGWRLMGLSWYWWVLIGGIIVGGALLIRKTVIKPFPSIVKLG